MGDPSPCLTCGACCAYFRVSFYWRELHSAGGSVPDDLTQPVNDHLSCMQGTNSRSPRCVALLGTVGEQVRCTVYEQRPSPCREFDCSGEVAVASPQCDRARQHYGLPPLVPLIQPLPEVAIAVLVSGAEGESPADVTA